MRTSFAHCVLCTTLLAVRSCMRRILSARVQLASPLLTALLLLLVVAGGGGGGGVRAQQITPFLGRNR